MAVEKNIINEEKVIEFIRNNPDFLKNNSQLFELVLPPEVDHGGNVVDMQYFMLGKLQDGLKTIKNKYEGLVLSSRDNMSTLSQVHESVLSIVRARDLEQLLEIISVDLPAVFNVDIVKIAIESEAAEFFETRFEEHHDAGISFLASGAIDEIFGKSKSVLLIADTEKYFGFDIEPIFSDCFGIIESAVLLRMRLPATQKNVILAFGVRIKNHFHEGQGTEMLSFLSQIIEHRLDQCLNDSGIAGLI
ncbi:MAG: DUF484 family protein [Pseudomonadota bacterium]